MCTPDLKERYVNFYTDFAFKKLFGTEVNKDLLISFLNSLFMGKEVVDDLEYLSSEQLGASTIDRRAVFDVYCRNSQGERFLIEMQKTNQRYFKDRSIYYSTFPIQEQAQKGDWNFRLDKVYTIGILNFTFDDSDPEYYHHEVQLLDIRSKKVFYDKLTYIYIEMPKFQKNESELESLFDKWLYAMKHLSTLDKQPETLQEAVFARLFEQAEIAKFSLTEQRIYRDSQKDLWDLFSIKETAEEKGRKEGIEIGREEGREIGREEGREIGREEGREEGREIGREEGREIGREEGREIGREEGRKKGLEEGLEKGERKGIAKIAQSMKQQGFPIEQIAQVTELTKDEIDAL